MPSGKGRHPAVGGARTCQPPNISLFSLMPTSRPIDYLVFPFCNLRENVTADFPPSVDAQNTHQKGVDLCSAFRLQPPATNPLDYREPDPIKERLTVANTQGVAQPREQRPTYLRFPSHITLPPAGTPRDGRCEDDVDIKCNTKTNHEVSSIALDEQSPLAALPQWGHINILTPLPFPAAAHAPPPPCFIALAG